MKSKIWLSPPHLSGREMQYVRHAFETNFVAPVGPNVDAFEQEICKFTGSPFALAASSGTAALHLALMSLGVSKGDIVLCQSLTFCASANPIVYQGATPVFIDSELLSWNICPDATEQAILHFRKKGKTPKAIVVVHLYGTPASMSDLHCISTKYAIPIIEDAAEALGTTYRGQQAGTMGDLGVFSFNGNKIITTSGGGALISSRGDLIQKARYLAGQARENASHYEHRQIGYNYKLSNVCAGIGLGQMEVLTQRIQQRRSIFDYYTQALKDIPAISFQPEHEHTFSNRWLTALQTDDAVTPGLRTAILQNLAAENIEARPVWKPMHLQPVFRKSVFFGSEVAKNLFENGICLPSGSALTQEDLNRVVLCIRNAAKMKKPPQ